MATDAKSAQLAAKERIDIDTDKEMCMDIYVYIYVCISHTCAYISVRVRP